MQAMYELDINSSLNESLANIKNVVNRNLTSNTTDQDMDNNVDLVENEAKPEVKEKELENKFLNDLSVLVYDRLITVDQLITKAAPDWPLDKINVIDRNILRIGLTELLFGDRIGVPPKVAIDEAIEIAKEFGGDKSGKFVNGVLGAVYKELGEPDKAGKSKKQQQEEGNQKSDQI